MNDYKNFLDRHSKYLRYLLVLSFITFVILLAATSAQGGCVGIDHVSSGSATATATGITISHTTSGTDRLMLVGVSINPDGGVTSSSVTYNGTALQFVGAQQNLISGADDARIEIWSLVAPDTGTHNVVITFSAALVQEAVAGVMTFNGVDQTTPLGTFASVGGDDSTPASVNIPSAAGELVFGLVACEYDAETASSGQREHWNIGVPQTYGAGGTDAGASPTVAMTWDLDVEATPSNHWAIGGVSIKPASSAGSLVMVTGDGSYWSGFDDNGKKTLFEGWGWTVTAIADDATQTTFNTAAVNNDVMYISESCDSGTVGTKARDLDMGIVTDEDYLWDEMEFGATGDSSAWHNTITINNNSHYITSPFSTGNLTVYTAYQDMCKLPTTLASGGQLLASENESSYPTLFAFETGATLDSGTAVNRRVGFPCGESTTSIWTANLETLLQRSVDWAKGCDAESGGGGGNIPPSVNAGTDQNITLPASANLDGYADDGGDGPGPLTTTWSKVSGPGTVSFGDANAQDTTASFSAAGTYVLKLTANDGSTNAEDTVQISVTAGTWPPLPAPPIGEYSCYMKITIDHTKVSGSTPLVDFPVLISLTEESLKTTGTGCGFVVNSDGSDIVFTNADKSEQLYHEIEKYDGTTGELVAWVKIPSLSNSVDTVIYVYYGNNNVTSPQENPTGVWDSNYVGIWHLNQSFSDSTSNGNNGTNIGTTDFTGKIANARDFDGNNDYIRVEDDASLHISNYLTVEAWIYPNADYVWQTIVSKMLNQTEHLYFVLDDSSTSLYLGLNGVRNDWDTARDVATGGWHYVAFTYDGSITRVYRDDMQVNSSTNSGTLTLGSNTQPLYIGFNEGWTNEVWNGKMDEVRISHTARSAEWIATSYTNQNAPSSFYSVDAPQCPSTTPPISEFSCSVPITINSAKVSGTSNLTDFPVLISLTDTGLKTGANCGYVQNSNGYDIIFSDSTQTIQLDHEIEKYDGSTGELVAWVRIPTLYATADTTIYLHFGHSSTCGPTQNPTGVWDSNYTTVWHLKETSGGSGALKDSTSRANHGTDFNSPTFGATGKIGNAIDFDGANDYATMPTSGFSTSAGTVELWANIDTFPPTEKKYMFSHLTPSPTANRVYVDLKPDNTWGTGMGDTYDLVRGSIVNADTWYHLVLTWDGANVRGYKDGILDFGPTSYSGLTTVGNVYVSAWDGNQEWFNGTIDEVRVSNTTRSADWIQTEYNNQSDPSSFYSVGTSSCFFLSGFSCNRKITIDSSKVESTSDLTNFPVLIKIDKDCNIKTAANGGSIQNSSGWDIIFTDSDGLTQLDHEIEEYDGNSGDLSAWVRIPTLPYNSDKDIYMYYGKSGMTCDPSNPTGVWAANYKGVWHLNDTSGDTQDSTSYNTDGVVSGTVTRTATGEIDNAFDFYTNGEVDWGDPGDGHLDFGTGDMTLSVWVNMDNHRGVWEQVILKGKSSYQSGYQIEVDDNTNTFYFTINEQGGDYEWGRTASIPFSLDTWTYVVGVVDRANNLVRGYKDGVQVDTSDISLIGSIDVSDVLTIGEGTWGWPDARIEEVRLANTARSAGWIKTEYNNQNDPSSFYGMSQDTCGGTHGFNYQYCKKITVDRTQVIQASNPNFPLLINLQNYDDLKTEENGGRVGNDNGWDIVFKTSDCQTLDHEIDYYDGATGTLVAWVRIPDLTNTEDYEIYMYYGDSNVICSPENPDDLWDPSIYEAVYHLSDDYKDSTSNDRDGTNNGTTFSASQIGRGALFNPSDGWDHIDLGAWNVNDNDLVIQAWAWPNDFNQGDPRIVSKCADWGSSSQQHVFMLSLYNGDNGENRMRFRVKTGTDNALNTVELFGNSPTGYLPSAQEWYFLTSSYIDSSDQMKLWRDATGDATIYQSGWLRQNSWPVWIGANPYGSSNSEYTWDGILDEVRIISQPRSAGWITTEYRNQSDPGNFYTVGSCFEQTSEVTQEWVEEVQ